jgi:DNA-damage-inducible protein J
MMRQTTSIKLDVAVKIEAQKVFSELGLTLGEAVNLFLNQVRLNKGLPFEVKIPNKETIKVLQEAKEGINMEKISLDELVNDMDIIRTNAKS